MVIDPFDLAKFFRNIRLKAFFSKNPTSTPTPSSGVDDTTPFHLLTKECKVKGTFNPPPTNYIVETFISLVRHEMVLLIKSAPSTQHTNFSKQNSCH
ncbi:hypothetical protein FKM82_025480 [Ascaphus truei]